MLFPCQGTWEAQEGISSLVDAGTLNSKEQVAVCSWVYLLLLFRGTSCTALQLVDVRLMRFLCGVATNKEVCIEVSHNRRGHRVIVAPREGGSLNMTGKASRVHSLDLH